MQTHVHHVNIIPLCYINVLTGHIASSLPIIPKQLPETNMLNKLYTYGKIPKMHI